MKKKKEFNSIHFLLILSVFVLFLIMLLPKISNTTSNIFIDDIKELYNIVNNSDNKGVSSYSKSNKVPNTDLKLDYCIILDKDGNIDKFASGNDSYYVLLNDINDISNISEKDIINEKYPFTTCNKLIFENDTKCSYKTNNLKSGDTYNNGSFEYKYNYHLEASSLNEDGYPTLKWVENDDYTGWGVRLRNRNLDNQSMKVCSSINDEPVVSMSYLFSGYMKESDFSEFDTRNVIDMSHMFYFYYGNKDLSLTTFDTSNVKDMSYMFENTGIKTLNLSSFIINEDANINGIFNNNRILINVKVNDNKTINRIRKYNDINKRLVIEVE